MKRCPYCGASLPGSAVSFCPNCGKPQRKRKKPPQSQPKKKQAKRPPTKKPPGPKQVPTTQQSVPVSKAPDDGYDGYYNDVLPIDSNELPEQMDPALMKQIIILLAGAAAIIVLAIILMTLL